MMDALTRGEWKPGEAIPAERRLAERFGISIGTVRKAIDELVAENILIRQQGRGTYVASHNRDRMLFYFFHIVPTSRAPSVSGRASSSSFARGKADRAGAEQLGIGAGEPSSASATCLSSPARRSSSTTSRCRSPRFPGLTERQFRHRAVDDLQPLPGGVRHLRGASERAAPRDRRRRRDRRAAFGRRAARRCCSIRRVALHLQRRSDRAARSRSSTPRATNTSPTSASLRSVSFASFFAQLVNGLAGASALFLVAAGLTLIFGVTRVVNFAHGSFYMLGAYIAYSLVAALRPRSARLLDRRARRGARRRADRRGDRGAGPEAHLRGAGTAAARRDVRHRADRARRRPLRLGRGRPARPARAGIERRGHDLRPGDSRPTISS